MQGGTRASFTPAARAEDLEARDGADADAAGEGRVLDVRGPEARGVGAAAREEERRERRAAEGDVGVDRAPRRLVRGARDLGADEGGPVGEEDDGPEEPSKERRDGFLVNNSRRARLGRNTRRPVVFRAARDARTSLLASAPSAAAPRSLGGPRAQAQPRPK